jgi:hypothetical protein
MNIKEPIHLKIVTNNLEMHDAFRERMAGAHLDSIGGLEFCVVSSEIKDGAVKADLMQFLRVTHIKPCAGWAGEGKPPVGTLCEFAYHRYPESWYAGTIRYMSGVTCVIETGLRCEKIEHPDILIFRPIRTPEQIAADQYEQDAKEIAKILSDLDGADNTFVAKTLLDCGYRRFESVES